jgi:hypothetical protein
MKILITGETGLAKGLAAAHHADDVTCVSRSNGHDIALIQEWGIEFLDRDIVYNCAYHDLHQLSVLEFFYNHWKNDKSKTIVNIGSRVVYFPRSQDQKEYWNYQLHKQTLQSAFEQMLPGAECVIKLINPGPIDTKMVSHLSVPKFSVNDLASRIKSFVDDPVIRRVDLWV